MGATPSVYWFIIRWVPLLNYDTRNLNEKSSARDVFHYTMITLVGCQILTSFAGDIANGCKLLSHL